MSKVDRLRRKLIKEHPERLPNYNNAVASYFDMVSYCFNNGKEDREMPEIDSPAFWELFDQLDLRCTREEMQRWIGFPEGSAMQ